jgi:hypothetical protein
MFFLQNKIYIIIDDKIKIKKSICKDKNEKNLVRAAIFIILFKELSYIIKSFENVVEKGAGLIIELTTFYLEIEIVLTLMIKLKIVRS